MSGASDPNLSPEQVVARIRQLAAAIGACLGELLVMLSLDGFELDAEFRVGRDDGGAWTILRQDRPAEAWTPADAVAWQKAVESGLLAETAAGLDMAMKIRVEGLCSIWGRLKPHLETGGGFLPSPKPGMDARQN